LKRGSSQDIIGELNSKVKIKLINNTMSSLVKQDKEICKFFARFKKRKENEFESRRSFDGLTNIFYQPDSQEKKLA
jgi:hypothetical protein